MSSFLRGVNQWAEHQAGEPWIQTVSGRKVHPLNLTADEIVVEDIAHALAHQARWTGHARDFISVAEHCVHVANVLPDRLKLHGLLHDASEAYLGDVASPTKRAFAMEGYRMAEHRAELAILEAFGLPRLSQAEQREVKDADLRMLHTEALVLMSPLHPEFKFPLPPYPHVRIRCWSPKEARAEWIRSFKEFA